jgi:cyanamide hydratase
MAQDADANGWTAVPRSLDQLLQHSKTGNTKPYSVDEIPLPSSPVAKQAMEYAKQHLPVPTFNHSMRVFYYGTNAAA